MQVFYTVNPGDNLNSIASRWNIPLNSLILANNLKSPFTIYPGQQLSMPPGISTYVVKPRDTLFTIAQRYGLPLDLIIEANTIDYPYIINPGQVLNIPRGVPYYVVRRGDTLYNIASRYNVTVNGRPRPDLIISANDGLTEDITPGMVLAIPYPPPGGTGKIAVVFNDDINTYIGIYNPDTGGLSTMAANLLDQNSDIFWSPDQSKIAAVDSNGIVSIVDVNTKQISKIDQISSPGFVDWARDGRRIVYSNSNVIRIYDVVNHIFQDIDRPGASYVQWFPDGNELLFEARDPAGISQLYKINISGANERKLTNNRDFPFNDVRLSPNGGYVLYTSPGVSISEIYVINLQTGSTIKIPGGPEAKNYFPAWSPDSTKIAYSSTHFNNGRYYSLIRVSGVRGDGDHTVAASSCYSTPVAWSPDSRRTAYLSGCREEFAPVEVWTVDAERPVPMNAMYGFSFFNIAWS